MFVRSSFRPLTRAATLGSRLQSSYSKIAKVTTLKEFENLTQSPKLSVFDFYATWCGPCKAMNPFIEKFSETYKDVKFYKVDVDKLTDLSTEFGVSAMPTFALIKDGDVVSKVIGANPNAVHNLLIRATRNES